MSRNLKFFFIAISVSLFLGWGINVSNKYLEGFLFFKFYYSPQLFSAQAMPISITNPKREVPQIEAKSALSVRIDKAGHQKILFEKNPDEILPIASLSKLMTALVVFENYDSSERIRISHEATDQPEDTGQLKIGEKLSVENLLYMMLIESSNDAAYAISDLIGESALVDLMNIEAKFLNLKNTHFIDPGGWWPENSSTARDLVKFGQYLLGEKPEIFKITKIAEFDLYDPDGIFHHHLVNTNQLLNKYPQIIGGKTGETNQAKGCLILILKDRKDDSILINVILGSEDRFGEMEKIIKYAL
jgi:D-alanyl-D-alanine carboxypeptidase